MVRMEKTISDNIESLRADLKATWEEVKNAINEMQPNLNTLTARVTEAEVRISDLEDKQRERIRRKPGINSLEAMKTESWK